MVKIDKTVRFLHQHGIRMTSISSMALKELKVKFRGYVFLRDSVDLWAVTFECPNLESGWTVIGRLPGGV